MKYYVVGILLCMLGFHGLQMFNSQEKYRWFLRVLVVGLIGLDVYAIVWVWRITA